jgi:hypothetical protein
MKLTKASFTGRFNIRSGCLDLWFDDYYDQDDVEECEDPDGEIPLINHGEVIATVRKEDAAEFWLKIKAL